MDRDRELQHLLRTVSQLKPLPPAIDPETETLTHMKCACNKLVEKAAMRILNTGVVHAVDNVCPGCRRYADELVSIVCVRCKAVVARMAPCVDKLGFQFKAGGVLHTECCGVCQPGLEKSYIIEQLIHYRRLGRQL